MKKTILISSFLVIIIAFIVGVFPSFAQNFIVVLDPGHGGADSGAGCSYNGKSYKESEINLKIATAAKKYLEEYKGVTVYLTRTDNNTKLNNGQRVAFASSVGANFLLSIHCNSTAESSKVNGALAIASYSEAFEKEAAKATRNVGTYILESFSKVGFANKGLYLKRATDVDSNYKVYYPDGTEQDYYGMTQRALRIGMPCTLMECGFMSSATDMAVLSSDSKLDELGKACAEGLAKNYGFSKDSEINAPETHSINGDNIVFNTSYACDLIYAYTGDGVISNGSYAEIRGNGAGKVQAYIDYMGMTLQAKDYNSMTITMKAGCSCSVDVYVSAAKEWNHENVVADKNKVTFNLTDEFQTFTINLSSLPVWSDALNYLEFYVSGSEYLMIKTITAEKSKTGATPTVKPSATLAPATATVSPALTSTPSITPSATQNVTPNVTSVATETPVITSSEVPTTMPTQSPKATSVPEITESAVPSSESETDSKTKDSGKTIVITLILVISALCVLAFLILRKR